VESVLTNSLFGSLVTALNQALALWRYVGQPLMPVAGSGRGLWGKNSTHTFRKLRDEWNR
jgi:hypothetical protein